MDIICGNVRIDSTRCRELWMQSRFHLACVFKTRKYRTGFVRHGGKRIGMGEQPVPWELHSENGYAVCTKLGDMFHAYCQLRVVANRADIILVNVHRQSGIGVPFDQQLFHGGGGDAFKVQRMGLCTDRVDGSATGLDGFHNIDDVLYTSETFTRRPRFHCSSETKGCAAPKFRILNQMTRP